MIRRSSGRAGPFVRSAAAAAVAVLLGCGKVGDPLPPIIRIPQSATDLQVEQAGYQLRFSWTNPPSSNGPTERSGQALILAGSEVIADAPVSGPGQRQALTIEAREQVGSRFEFSIRFRTERGELSPLSNTVSMEVLPVPGPGAMPRAAVDQGRILLEWEPPGSGAVAADAYRVYRSGEPVSDRVVATRFEDAAFDEGERYTYTVVPLRQTDRGWIEGLPYEPVPVVAVDRTPPSPPRGLTPLTTSRGVYLQWEENPESDVVRYRVFRRASDGAVFEPIAGDAHTVTAFFDAAYQAGHAYAVSAVDRAGNESERSEMVEGDR